MHPVLAMGSAGFHTGFLAGERLLLGGLSIENRCHEIDSGGFWRLIQTNLNVRCTTFNGPFSVGGQK